MAVYEYDWRNESGERGTLTVGIPSTHEPGSWQAGYAAAEAEIGCQISNWRERPDLKSFEVVQRIDNFGKNENRTWIEQSTSKETLLERWRQSIEHNRDNPWRVAEILSVREVA